MRKYCTIFLLLIVACLPGCGEQAQKRQDDHRLVVVNVLDRALYDDCHIRGSIHVPFDEIEAYGSTLKKDVPVVFYCSNYLCTSSDFAAETFRDNGFSSVRVYRGGMAEWYQKGYPSDGPAKASYLNKEGLPQEKIAGEGFIGSEELRQLLGL